MLAVLLMACGSGARSATNATPSSNTSMVVIRGSEISGNLLDGMRSRYGRMTVAIHPGSCPQISFRGQRTLNHQPPSVYVDNSLMLDTCILTQMNSSDIDRIEVYPSGQASRPGVQFNPSGVILVYRVRD